MARTGIVVACQASLLVMIGCSPPAHPIGAASIDLSVNGALNRMPSLAVEGHRVVLAWTATVDDVMSVHVAVSEDAGLTFSAPQRIGDTAERVSANAEQPPRVALSGDVIAVIWPSKLDGGSAIRMSRSSDGGRTFGAPASVHSGGLTGLRGWQAIARGRSGAMHAVWLDGRHAEPSSGGHHHHGTMAAADSGRARSAPRQDVYSAVIAPDGSTIESHVSRDVCFCCKTAVGIGPSGRVYAAWRHIFPESIRDIALAISEDAGRSFGPLARVSHDNWKLSGCPDDGPALAVDGRDTVHLVWPTLIDGETPRKAVFYSSASGGKSFTPRVQLSSDTTEDAGHPQIAVDAAGNVAAVWDEQAGGNRNIVVSVSRGGSSRFERGLTLTPGGSGFHPVVAGLIQGFLVAWPEGSGQGSAIRVQRMGV